MNGDVTVTIGALVSVEPATAMLPVAPVKVHSGAVPSAGAVVGQVSVEDLFTDDAGAAGEEVSDFDPQAEIVTANAAAKARTARGDDSRGGFTVVTLQVGRQTDREAVLSRGRGLR